MATADTTSVAAQPVVVPVVSPPSVAAPKPPAEPTPWRINVDQYYRMAEAGIFGPEDRVELINGAIIRMNPIGNRHADCCDRLNEVLVVTFLKKAKIRVGNPVRLDEESEPQPDFAILKLREEPRTEHPGPSETLVAIEVADSSLRFDRNVKAPLYATAGIPEFWLVDLNAETIEVRRKPSKTGYEELQTLRRGDKLACAAFPDLALDVAEILG